MKKLNIKSPGIIICAIAVFSIVITSCRPDPEEVERDMINEWIWDAMNEVYLWSEEIDKSLYPTDLEPKEFFEQILYPDDRFSWIVDDYQTLINSFNNVEISNGISPYFIRISGTENVIVVVEYVAKGSPADIAGIKRGDIITDINGTEITIDNYIDLFYSETSTLTFANYIDGSLYSSGIEITLTAVELDQNPVHHFEMINYENLDIGYMVYNHFTAGVSDKWLDSLDYLFAEIQSTGLDELIIDLRYNPGGSIFMATHLASMLAPAATLLNDNPFVNLRWNDLYQDYFMNTDGEDSENLVVFFEKSPSVNLDLSSVYFLTTGHSASASELLITGLDPYLDVVQIGDSTYGKCYGSITVDDTEEPKRHEWAMQPIVFKFANALGYTDFIDGIPPDYLVPDFMLDARPFGDISDPQLAKALEIISGVSPLQRKSVQQSIPSRILPDPVRDKKNKALLDTEFLKVR